MPGMLDGDQANMSLLFWRKVVSSTFSSRLRRELIRAFLSGLSGSRGTTSTSSSGFHHSSEETSRRIPLSRFLGVSQDRVNIYDLLWGLLDGIATLNLLDGFLRHELNAGAFSYDLFEVYLPRSAIGCVMPMCSMEGTILIGAFSYDLFEVHLPRSAIGCVMPMCSMEGTILVGTSLVRNSLQRWWSLQPGLILHLGQNLMYRDGELHIAFICWCTTLGCLLSKLFCGNSIVIPEHVAFHNQEYLSQSLAGSYS
ncbi:unnamed protein product [Prunus armeniaca]